MAGEAFLLPSHALHTQVMNKAHIAQQRYEAQVAQEIAVLRAADHPAVSRLYAHFEDATSIYAVLEYCTQGVTAICH